MSMRSWGNFPKLENSNCLTYQDGNLKDIIEDLEELIPYGNGRSYGDSALSKNIINVRPHDYFLGFDDDKGMLHVQSGVLLSEILDIFVPRGWFLRITPGTKLITIGGAIASDVHGKNHHIEGCFSESVEMLNLMLPDGNVIKCSKNENVELFNATCGGMGLTGVILDAKISLKKINSKNINQITIKTDNLRETFDAFEENKDKSYSVAWIDCLAKGEGLGRSLLNVGEFSDDGDLAYKSGRKLNIPFFLPGFVLNKLSVKAFNYLYYRRIKKTITENKVDIDTFFYPLDSISNWNRIYGNKGFAQYQFILPKENSFNGLEEILSTISDSGKGSFLAVLKLYGKANENYLSFPMEGYSLALDFKIDKETFNLFDELDKLVLKHGGRFYLAN
jgi:FAD/FMN-containing dehydrogenase